MDTESIPELPPEAEARLAALIADQRERRAGEESARLARRRLWLSHHWPDEYERCSIIGTRHVCRRCLVLYPLAVVTLVCSLAGLQPWPDSLDAWMIWLLCIPATVEFLAEKLLGTPYDARRQVIVTALVAVALGRGLSYEVADRWSWLFWGPVIVFGAIWFAAAMYRAQRTMFEGALAASRLHGDFKEDVGDPSSGDD